MAERRYELNSADNGLWGSEGDFDAPLHGETGRQLALRWVVRLRYGLITGEAALIAALLFGLQLSFPLTAIAVAVCIQTLSNVLLTTQKSRLNENAEHVVGSLFILDTLCLTVILGMTGGPENPFSLLYLVQITFSAIVLRKLWTWTLGVVSTVSFGILFWFSNSLSVFHEHGSSGGFTLHLSGMWVAFTTSALLISFFVGKLSAESRRKEREILIMQKRLAKNDRLASLVTLAAGAAHEIATPLSTIAVTAREMEHDAGVRLHDQRIEEDSRLIRSQVERCRLILERMGARGADPFGETPRSTDLGELLVQVRDRFPDQQKRIQVRVNAGEPTHGVIPARAAVEALSALVKNALDASPESEPITLQTVRPGPDRIRFLVRDEGAGMNSEVLERVAEPFFTTKRTGQGMGLGAFLVHLFAQAVGGQLSYDSQPGHGCTAILELPDMKHAQL